MSDDSPELMRAIGGLESEVKGLHAHIDTRIDALQAQLSAHDSRVIQITARIQVLETWKAKVMGAVIGVGALAGLLSAWLAKKLGI